jgi:hypothetical protein
VEQLLTSMATSLATLGLWRDRPGRVPAAETTSDLRRWGSRLGDSNSRPTHYECVALPTELRRRAAHGQLNRTMMRPGESNGRPVAASGLRVVLAGRARCGVFQRYDKRLHHGVDAA